MPCERGQEMPDPVRFPHSFPHEARILSHAHELFLIALTSARFVTIEGISHPTRQIAHAGALDAECSPEAAPHNP